MESIYNSARNLDIFQEISRRLLYEKKRIFSRSFKWTRECNEFSWALLRNFKMIFQKEIKLCLKKK